jgi:hypothetical protein
MSVDWDGRAELHCGVRLRVTGGRGKDFLTAEPCPAGVPAGIPILEVYERCLRCPVARRHREKRKEA